MPEEYVGPSSAGSERGRRAGHEKGRDDSKQKTNGETQKQETRNRKLETDAKEQRRGEREEIERRREQVRKNLEKKFKGEKETPQVAFKEAKEALEVRAQIRDEKDVIISPNQLKKYKRLLTEGGGFDPKAVEEMSVGEIEVYAMEVLKQRGIAEPEKSDFNETLASKRKAEAAHFRTLKSIAISDQEEVITTHKADKHIIVEEFGEKGTGRGVGAMEAEIDEQVRPIEQRSFKDLLQEKLDNLDNPISLEGIDREIERRVRSNNPYYIHRAISDLETLRAAREHDPALIEQINEVLDPALQVEFLEAKNALDERYTEILESLTITGREANLKGLDEAARNALIALHYGSYGGRAESFEAITENLIGVAIQIKDTPGLEGLRVWYALQKAVETQLAHDIQQRFEIQPDPYENIKSIYEAMKFAEKSRSLEGFGLVQQRIEPLLQAVELSTNKTVTAEMKKRVREHVEAFLKVTPNFILMYQSDGDAEQELRAATNMENESLFYFYDRFSDLRDKNGRLYFVDGKGDRLVDANGNLLNALSEMENSDTKQYMLDRFRVRQVEEITKQDLDISSANTDEQWLIKRILNLPQNQELPHLTLAQLNQLRSAWNDNKTKREVAWEWYNKQTYIGVNGYYTENSIEVTDIDVNDAANTVYFGRRLRDVREDEIAKTTFRKRLIAAGMTQERIDALFEDYDTLQALKTIGANLARYKYSSAMDRFRIYDRSGDVIASVFGEETPFNEREADQMPDYFLQEGHGDPRVNRVVREKLDEKFRSFMLASNMRMYRLLQLKGVLNQNQRDWFDVEVEAEMNRTGLKERYEVEAYVLMDMIYKGFDENAAPGTEQMDIFNINWGEASKYATSYTFEDNARDRVSTVKFFREAYKEFIFQPTEANFIELMKRYYSSRQIRKRQAADFFLEVYGDLGRYWKAWFDLEHNITDVDFGNAIDIAVNENVIDKPRAEKLKSRTIGPPVVREIKQWAKFLGVSALEFGRPGYLFGSFWDFLKTLMAYLSQAR